MHVKGYTPLPNMITSTLLVVESGKMCGLVKKHLITFCFIMLSFYHFTYVERKLRVHATEDKDACLCLDCVQYVSNLQCSFNLIH